MLPPADAWRALAAHAHPLAPEEVPRGEARGRVLAAPLAATVDIPFADVSAMDGYAVRGPIESGSVREVTHTIAAGDPPGITLDLPSVARIMTGAPVPRGADRVVPIELTDGGEAQVRFERGVAEGAHIRRRGEVIRAGGPLLPAGLELGPVALSVAASHGLERLPVHRPPSLALLVTGDEVVAPHHLPGPGQLRDSHTDLIRPITQQMGLAFTSLGIAGDDPDDLVAAAHRGLDHDVLCFTGGVSMGAFDHGLTVLDRLGFRVLFHKVAIQPGKPLVVAVPADPATRCRLVFGLPGNPASVLVTMRLFVVEVLRALQGLEAGYWRGALAAVATADLPGAKDRDRFLPARLRIEGATLRAEVEAPLGSHDLSAWARAQALVRIPAHAAPAPAGASCEVLPL